jgi:hypothetical protein
MPVACRENETCIRRPNRLMGYLLSIRMRGAGGREHTRVSGGEQPSTCNHNDFDTGRDKSLSARAFASTRVAILPCLLPPEARGLRSKSIRPDMHAAVILAHGYLRRSTAAPEPVPAASTGADHV